MSNATEYLKEIAFYIRRMPEADRLRLKSIISHGKNGRVLNFLIKEVEKIDPFYPGFIVLQGKVQTGYKKHVHEIKAAILELEGSLASNLNLKGHDSYDFIFMELRKELIAAQAMAEKDAYQLSIDAMKDIYAKAKKLEVLQVQKDCADHLTTFYTLSGDALSASWWLKENMQLSVEIANAYKLQGELECRIDRLPCCGHHHHHADDINTWSQIPRSRIRKISWMMDVLNFEKNRFTIDARESHASCVALFREIQADPIRFPLHYRATMTKLLLEDLFSLKRYNLLSAFADQIDLLNYLPAYRRIPLINFFVHFHLKQGNLETLRRLILNARSNAAYQIFQPFLQKLDFAELLYHFIHHDHREVLRLVNRNGNFESKCPFVDFDIRALEVLSLFRIGEDNTAFDKLESLRRFLFRHDELKGSDYCMSVYKCIRIQIVKKYDEHHSEIVVDQGKVYDLRPLISEAILPIADFKPYPMSDLTISMAAEIQPNSTGLITENVKILIVSGF